MDPARPVTHDDGSVPDERRNPITASQNDARRVLYRQRLSCSSTWDSRDFPPCW